MMNNKLLPKNKKNIVHTFIIATLIGIACTIILSWPSQILGYVEHNLLTTEGIRWLMRHGVNGIDSLLVQYAILFTWIIGSWQSSGLNDTMILTLKKGIMSLDYRRRFALIITIVWIFTTIIGLFILLYSSLDLWLNTFGEFRCSPLANSLKILLAICLVSAAEIFSIILNENNRLYYFCNTLYYGFTKYTAWIFLIYLLSEWYTIFRYMLNA